jgi:proline dehydrogenase
MLRAILIRLSQSDFLCRLFTRWWLSRRVASRFVAGDTLEEATHVVAELNQQGLLATMDRLGEHIHDLQAAEAACEMYVGLLEAIAAQGLKSGISIKLSQLGLEIDHATCLEHLLIIAREAARLGIFVRIDMEHSDIVDDTLKLYEELRDRAIDNCGVVIQSYLRRSLADTEALMHKATPIRLVKGAYDEPPSVAFPEKVDTDRVFDALSSLMIQHALELGAEPISADGRTPPLVALGTHDDKRIEFGKNVARDLGLPRSCLEIQLLYGIRAELGRQLADEGYPVRIYVPYGTEWYSYFMRRLAERPANLWFFLSNLFRA